MQPIHVPGPTRFIKRLRPSRTATIRSSALATLAAVAALSLSACSQVRLTQPVAVASAFTSHQLCSEMFISGLPEPQIMQQRLRETGLMHVVLPLTRTRVDRAAQTVDTTIAGTFHTHAQYQPELGCLVSWPERTGWQSADTEWLAQAHGAAPRAAIKAMPDSTQPLPAPEQVIEQAVEQENKQAVKQVAEVLKPANAGLEQALELAFTERTEAPFVHTKAVVIMQHGRIIAERYADGVTPDTALLGFSMSKSVTNALVGVAVRKAWLRLDAPAPITAWAAPDDPHHGITLDHLLRHTSGIATTHTENGFDIDASLLYLERDPAAGAAALPIKEAPGLQWEYTDSNYQLIGRTLRDAARAHGLTLPEFARRELFAPLGMQHALIETDATGTPFSSTYTYASARDWARFGQFYLKLAHGQPQSVVPDDWYAYTTRPTLGRGYGAGFWLNHSATEAPWGGPWGMPHVPSDTIWAMGLMGQHTIIIPSRDLVVVRLGVSHHYQGLLGGMDKLMQAILKALPDEPAQPELSQR